MEVTSLPANLRHSLSQLRAVPLREWIDRIAAGYRENDLWTFASAIAFRVLFAIVPLLLFAFGLMGFLDLSSVWREDIAPHSGAAQVQLAALSMLPLLMPRYRATAG